MLFNKVVGRIEGGDSGIPQEYVVEHRQQNWHVCEWMQKGGEADGLGDCEIEYLGIFRHE